MKVIFRPVALWLTALLVAGAGTGLFYRLHNLPPPARGVQWHAPVEQPPPGAVAALAAATPREQAAPHRLAVLVEAAVLRLQKDPAPKVILPDAPTPPAPPPPSPSAVQKVGADQLYVFRCTVDCLVFTSPKGLAKITKAPGPLQLYGKFTDGQGGYELRSYAEKWVYILTPAGVGRVELIICPAGAGEDGAICRVLDVDNGGPAPKPPDPKPPDPKPPEPPAPIPGAGLRVLILYETAQSTAMPKEQQNILFGKPMRDYLKAKCIVDKDNPLGAFRIWDKDVSAAAESKPWQDALARPRASIPWLIISNGKTGWEGPLPATVDATMAIIKKYEQ